MDSVHRRQLTTKDHDKEESVKCKKKTKTNQAQASSHRKTGKYCCKCL